MRIGLKINRLYTKIANGIHTGISEFVKDNDADRIKDETLAALNQVKEHMMKKYAGLDCRHGKYNIDEYSPIGKQLVENIEKAAKEAINNWQSIHKPAELCFDPSEMYNKAFRIAYKDQLEKAGGSAGYDYASKFTDAFIKKAVTDPLLDNVEKFLKIESLITGDDE